MVLDMKDNRNCSVMHLFQIFIELVLDKFEGSFPQALHFIDFQFNCQNMLKVCKYRLEMHPWVDGKTILDNPIMETLTAHC